MKAVALLLCALGFAAAAANNGQQVADKEFVQKQQDLLHLFVNLEQPNNDQQQQQQAQQFNFQQQQQNSNNQNAVKQFQNAYEQGQVLPRGEVFNYNNPNQRQQAIQLFDLFYFAKDYNTFYQAACWARNNINEGQFVYALSVAILNRPDTQGINLPPQSEVNPYLYINTQAVQQAQNYKQQGQKQVYVQSNNTNNYQQQKQQQQQQQQHQQPQDYPFSNQYQNQYENQNQANQYQDQNQYNREGRVSYYNEDVNLNQQFAYEQLKNPAWFNNQKYQNKQQQQNQNQNNGENYFYYLQQALARYNLERYSNDLPNVRPFQFNKNIRTGYNPQLVYGNGQAVAARPDNVPVYNANSQAVQQFKNIDRRIADAVDNQQAQAADGSKVQLDEKNGAQVLGNLVQNNGDSVNNHYYAANNGQYGYVDQCRKVVGSVVNNNQQNNNAPTAIENDHSANRDPAFYQCVSRIVNYIQYFKNQLKPYNQDQINFQGVKVQSVNVDKLVTYFDNAEVDLYNAINYQQGELPKHFEYKAKQQQLNNKPFNYQIQVDSNQETNAIVRVFIGPKYNVQGQQYSLEQARQNFVEIDRFTVALKNGQNNIQRNSQQSTRFVQQQTSTRQLFSQLHQSQKEGEVQPYHYNKNVGQQQAAFPQNLILPKGSRNGQEYVLAVAVNSYQGNQQDQQNQQEQPQDNRPQGFPFDRVVREADFQQAQNIQFQTVKVYNKNQQEVNNPQQ